LNEFLYWPFSILIRYTILKDLTILSVAEIKEIVMPAQIEKKPIPFIDFTSFNPSQDKELLKQAVDHFLKSGCLLLKGIFEDNYITDLNDYFCTKYSRYLIDVDHSDALTVGEKRIMISVDVDGLFNSPDFYANPKLMSLLKILLGDNMIVGSIGAVASLPGSPHQHVHRDHQVIFDNEYSNTNHVINTENCVSNLLPYAITVALPLVAINETTGCTRSWPGTHLINEDELHKSIIDIPGYQHSGTDFTADKGDCFLFDYRLFHGGMPNKSNAVRPLVYTVYHRSWFRDTLNYPKQLPINLTDDNYRKIPKKYRNLFSWIKPGVEVIESETISRNDPCPCGSGLRYKSCHGVL
jgi:hypothetical protein